MNLNNLGQLGTASPALLSPCHSTVATSPSPMLVGQSPLVPTSASTATSSLCKNSVDPAKPKDQTTLNHRKGRGSVLAVKLSTAEYILTSGPLAGTIPEDVAEAAGTFIAIARAIISLHGGVVSACDFGSITATFDVEVSCGASSPCIAAAICALAIDDAFFYAAETGANSADTLLSASPTGSSAQPDDFSSVGTMGCEMSFANKSVMHALANQSIARGKMQAKSMMFGQSMAGRASRDKSRRLANKSCMDMSAQMSRSRFGVSRVNVTGGLSSGQYIASDPTCGLQWGIGLSEGSILAAELPHLEEEDTTDFDAVGATATKLNAQRVQSLHYGDTLLAAQALALLNTELETGVVMDQSFRDHLGAGEFWTLLVDFVSMKPKAREIDSLQASHNSDKGINKNTETDVVAVYELVGDTTGLPPLDEDMQLAYLEAMQYLRKGDWDQVIHLLPVEKIRSPAVSGGQNDFGQPRRIRQLALYFRDQSEQAPVPYCRWLNQRWQTWPTGGGSLGTFLRKESLWSVAGTVSDQESAGNSPIIKMRSSITQKPASAERKATLRELASIQLPDTLATQADLLSHSEKEPGKRKKSEVHFVSPQTSPQRERGTGERQRNDLLTAPHPPASSMKKHVRLKSCVKFTDVELPSPPKFLREQWSELDEQDVPAAPNKGMEQIIPAAKEHETPNKTKNNLHNTSKKSDSDSVESGEPSKLSNSNEKPQPITEIQTAAVLLSIQADSPKKTSPLAHSPEQNRTNHLKNPSTLYDSPLKSPLCKSPRRGAGGRRCSTGKAASALARRREGADSRLKALSGYDAGNAASVFDAIRAASPMVGRCQSPKGEEKKNVELDFQQKVATRNGFAAQTLGPTKSQPIVDINGVQWLQSDKKLGKGSFGVVHLGMRPSDGTLVAMKTIPVPALNPVLAQALEKESIEMPEMPKGRRLTPQQRQAKKDQEKFTDVLREVALLCALRHRNIVSCFGCAVVNQAQELIMAMEYVSGGSLEGLVEQFGALPIPAVQRYVKDMLRGLRYLHEKNVIHRDVKPGNVLLHVDGTCALTDFGTSLQVKKGGDMKKQKDAKNAKEEKFMRLSGDSVVGTPLFMSPEQARGLSFTCPQSDLWSVGISVVQMLTGEYPYNMEEVNSMAGVDRLVHRLGYDEKFAPAIPDCITGTALNFVEKCLQRDPMKRGTADELLFHPFLEMSTQSSIQPKLRTPHVPQR